MWALSTLCAAHESNVQAASREAFDALAAVAARAGRVIGSEEKQHARPRTPEALVCDSSSNVRVSPVALFVIVIIIHGARRLSAGASPVDQKAAAMATFVLAKVEGWRCGGNR